MQPYKYDPDGVPVFLDSQVQDYGFPEFWGFDMYRVIELPQEKQYAYDFVLFESHYCRPIHRYSRTSRFQTIVGQLLGDTGTVPQIFVDLIRHYYNPKAKSLWNEVRKILKMFRLRIYYNRIPFIVQQITKINSSKRVHVDQYRSIMEEFKIFEYWFEQKKTVLKRLYFPNMRFIALKLIHKQGIELNYDIPFTRTKRKRKELEYIWSEYNKV